MILKQRDNFIPSKEKSSVNANKTLEQRNILNFSSQSLQSVHILEIGALGVGNQFHTYHTHRT